MLGRGLSLSYEMVQSRVKTRFFEAPEQRLARKLQHAAQHTHAFRGKVDLFFCKNEEKKTGSSCKKV
jgi:hypothetical protein